MSALFSCSSAYQAGQSPAKTHYVSKGLKTKLQAAMKQQQGYSLFCKSTLTCQSREGPSRSPDSGIVPHMNVALNVWLTSDL